MNRLDRQRRHDELWQKEALDGLARMLDVLHDISDGIQQVIRTAARQPSEETPEPIDHDAPVLLSIEALSAFFEVADGELDGGVVAVELVGGDGWQVEVGDEGVVTPVRPERLLGRVGEAGAAQDETDLTCRRRAWPGHRRLVDPGARIARASNRAGLDHGGRRSCLSVKPLRGLVYGARWEAPASGQVRCDTPIVR